MKRKKAELNVCRGGDDVDLLEYVEAQVQLDIDPGTGFNEFEPSLKTVQPRTLNRGFRMCPCLIDIIVL